GDVSSRVRDHADSPAQGAAGRDRHAPGPDEPRRRDLERNRRRPAIGHPAASDERRCRTHGRPRDDREERASAKALSVIGTELGAWAWARKSKRTLRPWAPA